MPPKFHTTAHHYDINLVIYFLSLHNINMGSLKVRTTLFEKETFPNVSLQDISTELQGWGIQHELITSSCDITAATVFPTMAVIRIQEREVFAIINKVEAQQVYLQHFYADADTCTLNELTLLQYLDIKEIVIDAAFCEACRLEDLTEQEAYADTIFAVEDFLSDEECSYMIDYCEQHNLFNRSTTGAADGSSIISDNRASYSAFITASRQDPLFNDIIERAADLMEVEPARIEDLQCVRYGEGQEFRPHFDSYETGLRRKATILVYLNDNFKGGETIFPEIGSSVMIINLLY